MPIWYYFSEQRDCIRDGLNQQSWIPSENQIFIRSEEATRLIYNTAMHVYSAKSITKYGNLQSSHLISGRHRYVLKSACSVWTFAMPSVSRCFFIAIVMGMQRWGLHSRTNKFVFTFIIIFTKQYSPWRTRVLTYKHTHTLSLTPGHTLKLSLMFNFNIPINGDDEHNLFINNQASVCLGVCTCFFSTWASLRVSVAVCDMIFKWWQGASHANIIFVTSAVQHSLSRIYDYGDTANVHKSLSRYEHDSSASNNCWTKNTESPIFFRTDLDFKSWQNRYRCIDRSIHLSFPVRCQISSLFEHWTMN